jgi:hypothetical protein
MNLPLRKPRYLSHSALQASEKDIEEYFVRYIAPVKAANFPQVQAMAIGSAFDARVKTALSHALFGTGFVFEEIFESQVEEQNRDWALEESKYVFAAYKTAGAYDELLAELQKSNIPPRFEFSIEGVVGGVPMLGKPDCHFRLGEIDVILDWKVRGYCSKYAQSPTKHYRIVRDGHKLKASRNSGEPHPGYMPIDLQGVEIHAGYLEYANPTYADQTTMYGWLLGLEVGSENVVCRIDELCCKPCEPRPLIRVANLVARVSKDYQLGLLNRYQTLWDNVQTGLFFDLDPVKNAERVETLSLFSANLVNEDDWFASVVRKDTF